MAVLNNKKVILVELADIESVLVRRHGTDGALVTRSCVIEQPQDRNDEEIF